MKRDMLVGLKSIWESKWLACFRWNRYKQERAKEGSSQKKRDFPARSPDHQAQHTWSGAVDGTALSDPEGTRSL
ncbi:hypothetical protein MHYP_G00065260 [Metynnis hypsauchen]